MSDLVLSEDQEAAYKAFIKFTVNKEKAMCIQGYAGTGKTTLVKHILNELPNLSRTRKLLDKNAKNMEIMFTATTNKAAEALADVIGEEVQTIHSALGLIVDFDYTTKKSELKPHYRKQNFILENTMLFIDEASYIDNGLLSWINKRTQNCKIVYMGDPAQLLAVGCNYSPVFNASVPTAKLSKILRQAEGNPIIDLSAKFREVLDTGNFFSFQPDDKHIRHVPRETFNNEIEQEFLRKDWAFSDSKILAWTNKTVNVYNNHLLSKARGTADFRVGDYAVCNHTVANSSGSIKNGRMVHITHKSPDTLSGISGHRLELNHSVAAFYPDKWATQNQYIKMIEDACVSPTLVESEVRAFLDKWIDLRSVYASTINKSQGSTYDTVFIDLNDVGKCNMGSQIARLLYVAVSRARTNVVLTGDLV